MKTLAATALALAALAAAAPSGAMARSHTCRHHHGTLAANSYGNVWHDSTSLLACTTVYDHPPRARRLGPWAPGTKLAWDGVNALWTVRHTSGGVTSDRMWAASADSGKRWLSGTKLVPGAPGAPFTDGQAQRILLRDQGAAWITKAGQVVMALHDPADDPTPIGTLVSSPLTAVKQLLLVGTYPASFVNAIAGTMKLDELDGDGDECGGVNPYRLTFNGDVDIVAGATWDGYWESTNCS
jgi:hypothetical protein